MDSANILIVDDNSEIRVLIKTILDSYDFQTSIATNGKEVLHLLKEGHKFDLILLDIMMESMDGYETLEYLKSIDTNVRPRVCFLTAKRERKDIGLALKLGADDYLTKPIDKELLVTKVFDLLTNNSPDIAFSQIPVSLEAKLGASKKTNGIITQISEAYLEIESDIPLKKNDLIEVACHRLLNIFISETFYCRVVNIAGKSPKILAKVSFVGLTESEKGNIRSYTVNRRDIS